MAGIVLGVEHARRAEELLHDMRNPLGVIRGQCHGIVRCAGQPEALLDRLRIIDGEIDRVVTAIDRVRSALCGIACDEPPGPVDLVAVARDAVRRHEGSAAERGIALTASALTDHAEILGSADELRPARRQPRLERDPARAAWHRRDRLDRGRRPECHAAGRRPRSRHRPASPLDPVRASTRTRCHPRLGHRPGHRR